MCLIVKITVNKKKKKKHHMGISFFIFHFFEYINYYNIAFVFQ